MVFGVSAGRAGARALYRCLVGPAAFVAASTSYLHRYQIELVLPAQRDAVYLNFHQDSPSPGRQFTAFGCCGEFACVLDRVALTRVEFENQGLAR